MIAGHGERDFARPALNPAPMNGEHHLLPLRIVSRLRFYELLPFVAPPALAVRCSLHIQWIFIELGHRRVFICHGSPRSRSTTACRRCEFDKDHVVFFTTYS